MPLYLAFRIYTPRYFVTVIHPLHHRTFGYLLSSFAAYAMPGTRGTLPVVR